MITTNDEKIDKRLRVLREHGMSRTAINRESEATWYYDVVDIGYNYRLTEPQAALGMAQMSRIDEGIKRRGAIANYYETKLQKYSRKGIILPFKASKRSHIFHLYTLKVQKEKAGISRNDLFKKLLEKGIQSSVHYTPLHLLSFYKQFLTEKSCAFPVAEKIYAEILSLPIYPTITKKNLGLITTEIGKALLCKD